MKGMIKTKYGPGCLSNFLFSVEINKYKNKDTQIKDIRKAVLKTFYTELCSLNRLMILKLYAL